MAKILVQILLSVAVGIGAAMGFSPKARAVVSEALSRVDASLRETVSAAIANAEELTASTVVSVKANIDAFSRENLKADLNLRNDLKAKMNAGSATQNNRLPGLDANHSLDNRGEINLEIDGSGLDIEVRDQAQSSLNLGSGK